MTTLTLYDLLHACATVWLRSGVPLGEMQSDWGTASRPLISYYVQALTGDETTAYRKIEDALCLTPAKGSVAAGFTSD